MARILRPKTAEGLNILGLRVDRKPACPAAPALKTDPIFMLEFSQQPLHCAFREAGQDLTEFSQRTAGRRVVEQMAEQKCLVGLAIQAFFAGVNSFLAQMGIKATGKNVARAATPTQRFHHAQFDQSWQPFAQMGCGYLLMLEAIEDQKVMRGERGQTFLADLLDKFHERRIFHLAAQRKVNGMVVRASEIRKRLRSRAL